MGEPKHDGLAVPGRVVLAHETPFTIGRLRVDPPTRQVESGGARETLEPRVMEVLVALASVRGAILTRDELVERCWAGRIVTDDAINRVLSRIRQVGATIGGGSFQLETVTKVGYRLVDAVHAPSRIPNGKPSSAAESHVSRRAIIAGSSAAGLALIASGLLWQRPWRHRPVPEAEQLVRRGNLLTREAFPGQVRQSVSYFERAVALDPDYADAWGALALSYSHIFQGFDQAELTSLPARIRAAAARALELDSGNADAQLALIFITPYFRNWAAKEAALRRIIDDHPRHWLAHGRLGVLLYQVGRLSDGIEQHRMALDIEPMLPTAYYFLISNLSALGKVQEADAMVEKARARWPAHPAIWVAKFNHLLFSGRPKSAAAFAMDPASLPTGFGPSVIEPQLRLARAMETGAEADIEPAVSEHLRIAGEVDEIPSAAMVFAALGRPSLTFSSLERYFFDRGSFGSPSPIGRYTRRNTDMLFSAPMAAVRDDPRFVAMLRDLGLDAYWRQTRTVPDYRHPT